MVINVVPFNLTTITQTTYNVGHDIEDVTAIILLVLTVVETVSLKGEGVTGLIGDSEEGIR